MATPKDLKTFEAIYPIFIQKYETFIPSEENSGVTEKINSMIQYLSQIGRLNNDVVKNWNKVMEWLLAEGLGEVANIEINRVLASGVFDDMLSALVSEQTEQLDILVEGKVEELESILVDLRESGTGIDAQARQDIETANQQIFNKAEQSYVDNLASSLGNGSPKSTFATLANLQSAFPTGNTNTYVVTSDGNWYFWNGTAWTSGGVYQSTFSSEFPATNKVSNSKFVTGVTGWNANSGVGSTAGDVYSLTSSGTSTSVRTVNQTTGFIPKIGEKVYIKMDINVESTGITSGSVSFHDWTATGTYNQSRPIDTTLVGVWQTVSDVLDITTNFTEQVRFYYSFITTLVSGKKVSMKKPTIINLTEVFGLGNEPSKTEMDNILVKFGGSFEGTVSPFLNTKEINTSVNNKSSVPDFSVTNLIENGNFKDTNFVGEANKWKIPNIALASSTNNEVTFTATASGGQVSQVRAIVANRIYYQFAQIKALNSLVMLDAGGNSAIAKRHSGSGEYEFLSLIYSFPTNANIAFGVRDYNTSGFTPISAKYFGLLDLTEIFGVGNEPNKVEMDTLIKKLPNMWFDKKNKNLLSPKEIYNAIKEKTENVLKISPLEVRKSNPKAVSPPRLLMTITYDDECSSIYDLAFPIHQAENVEGTFYVVPDRIGTERIYNYGKADVWERLKIMNKVQAGRIAIEHHTLGHMTLGNRTKEELETQAIKAYDIFHRNGIYPKHIAYPGGNHDYNTLNVLQDYFQSGVTTADLVNEFTLNPMRIHRYGFDNRSVADIKTIIDNAVISGGWLISYQHGLSTTGMSLGGYQVLTPANQLEIIQYAKSKGFEIVSMDEGMRTYAPHQFYSYPNSYEPSFALRRNGTVYIKP